jgi:hypothetical protein
MAGETLREHAGALYASRAQRIAILVEQLIEPLTVSVITIIDGRVITLFDGRQRAAEG